MSKEEAKKEEELRKLRVKIRDIKARQLDIEEDLKKIQQQKIQLELTERKVRKTIDRLELDLEDVSKNGEKLEGKEFLLLDELKALKRKLIKEETKQDIIKNS